MKLNDAAWGALLLALSVAVLVAIQRFPTIPGQNIGPGAFPGLLASILAGCSLILLARGVRSLRTGDRPVTWAPWLRSPRHVGNALLTIGALVFYIVAADRLGFLVSATAILVALFLQLRVRPALAVPVAVVTAFAIHLVFYKGLRVSLPWGVVPILY